MKTIKRFLSLSIVLALFILSISTSYAATITLTSIQTSLSNLYIQQGTNIPAGGSVKVYAVYNNGSKSEITSSTSLKWSITDSTIAKLPYNGTIVGSKVGSTKLNLSYQNKTSFININVVDVISEAVKWIGTPYKMGGSSKKGIDCSNFVNAVYNNSNMKYSYKTATDWTKNPNSPPKNFTRVYTPVKGDIVIFALEGGYGHAGIYISDKQFIGSQSTGGVGYANFGSYWGVKRKVTGYYRYQY